LAIRDEWMLMNKVDQLVADKSVEKPFVVTWNFEPDGSFDGSKISNAIRFFVPGLTGLGLADK